MNGDDDSSSDTHLHHNESTIHIEGVVKVDQKAAGIAANETPEGTQIIYGEFAGGRILLFLQLPP